MVFFATGKTAYITSICVFIVGVALTTKISAGAEGDGRKSTGKQPIILCNQFGDKGSCHSERYGGGEESGQLHVECVQKVLGKLLSKYPLFINDKLCAWWNWTRSRSTEHYSHGSSVTIPTIQ
jgi:hypothetical protein